MMQSNAVTSSSRQGLVFASWNVKGINHPVKRSKVLSHLKSLSADIIFMQETHLKFDSKDKLKCRWIENIYQSNFSVKARGVAILIRKGVPFKLKTLKADKEGRYIILNGEIHSFPITLVNIYAPNYDNPDFFKKVFDLIPNMSQTNLIVGGDFNCVLDAYLDRSSSKRAPQSNSRNFLNAFINNSNLVDTWRLFHPTERDYTFHSQVHNVYTRIDYFLVENKLISNVMNNKIHDILISDHAPVTFELAFNNLTSSRPLWRMDPRLVSDPKFYDYMLIQLEIFFENNDTPDVSPGLLWETLKAFLRGCVISYQGSRNKLYKAKLLELGKQIHQLDNENAQKPSLEIYKKILQLRYEYNKLASDKLSKSFLFIKQRHFEFGDKPHKLLARQLRKLENDKTIHKIRTKSGIQCTTSKDINNSFKEFYSNLYTSDPCIDLQAMDKFLNKCKLPSLNQDERDSLNEDISLEELKCTVNSLKSGKTPGPDGLPSEVYKKFNDILSPYLLRTFEGALVTGLPATFNEAVITVIPKKGKSTEEVEGYRPISLLNVDQKILSKILSNRLGRLISGLIHTDQNGFIPGRNVSQNTRRLFNILYHSKAIQENLVIISLDAEKAFDRVEWHYLFAVLEKFDVGENFINWIKILYKSPSAQVLTNNTLSGPFNLQRGTRQGCPLSPLLFALTVEPLAECIRSDPSIHGFNTLNTVNKISLYADDILLYITKPHVSLPVILDIINTFGMFSGFKVNLNKSELMPIGLKDLSSIQSSPFKVSMEKFTYLGIVVTNKYSALLKANFTPLISKLQANIQFWRALPISLFGRINAIKMIFLPQVLYLFQNIPVFLPKSFFKQLDSIILPFLWGYKNHRVKKAHLCKPKQEGGLALPDFRLYYWACYISQISMWLDDHDDPPFWLQIIRDQCHPYNPGAVILSPVALDHSTFNNSIIIRNILRIWKQIKEHFKIKSLSFLTPIAKNPSFTPSKLDRTFVQWQEMGIYSIGDLFIDGALASFSQLQQKFKFPQSHFFRFLQIRNYIRAHIPSLVNTSSSVIDKCLVQCKESKKSLPIIYDLLQSFTSPCTSSLKEEWEKELRVEISEEIWQRSLKDINKQSINSRHCLIQFKVIHRLHYSKKKLHRIFQNVSPICDKCNLVDADLSHSFIFCSKIQSYWTGIFDVLSEIFRVQLQPDPALLILGFSEAMHSLSGAQHKLLAYSLITAKKLILLFWKKKEAPTCKLWLGEMISTLHLERIRYCLKGTFEQFDKIWHPFLCYLDLNTTA